MPCGTLYRPHAKRHKSGDGYILYTPATTDPAANAKLELYNAVISTTTGRAMYLPSAAPVDITVTGDNSLTSSAISIDGNGQAVSMTGTGNLTINGYYGIVSMTGSMSGVTINIDGDLKIKTSANPITGVSGNVGITAKSITIGDDYSVYCSGIASLEATNGDISLTGGSNIGAVYGSGGVSLKASGNITVDNSKGAIALSTGAGAVTVDAEGDVAITAGSSVAISFGTGVSVTSQTGSIDVTTGGYSCIEKTSGGAGGGAVTLNAAKDIMLNANSAAIATSDQAVDITAGGTLSSTSAYGFQTGALTIKANDVSIEGTQQDGIQASSVSITNTDDDNCESVSIIATSSDSSCAAIYSSGDITVKADDVFVCGNNSAMAISSSGTVTIGDAGVIVGTITAGTDSIDSRIIRAIDGGDKSDFLNLKTTTPTEATYYTAGNGYAVFIPADGETPAKLTLHNATISSATTPLTLGAETVIQLEGTNSITNTSTSSGVAPLVRR